MQQHPLLQAVPWLAALCAASRKVSKLMHMYVPARPLTRARMLPSATRATCTRHVARRTCAAACRHDWRLEQEREKARRVEGAHSLRAKSELHWAAFYGHCRHRIDKVTAGHRITLTYALRRRPGERGLAPLPPLPALSKEQLAAAA
jgi:hypothetical protein